MSRAVLLILVVFGCTRAGSAQLGVTDCGPPTSSDAGAEARFIECARAGTSRYQDRRAAILDGYRLIGSDFPAMGEHWINLALLFDSQFDPVRPEILSYIVIRGEPRLLGVAYAMPLLAGERAPDWPTSGGWHDHYRTLKDETALPEHHMPGAPPDHARMAMLHAWIWVDNPNGTFVADNWAIPYIRIGLPPPPNGTPDAAGEALSLLSGGSAYFMESIDEMAGLSPAERQRVELAFARAEAEVERVRSSPSLTARDTTDLSEIWSELWSAIDDSVAGAESLRPHELTTDSR